MRSPITRRLAPAVVAAVVAAAATGAVALGDAPHAEHAAHHPKRAAVERSPKALAFHDAMRKLWEDHITWTRLAIVSFAGDLPDLQPTVDRLLRNQVDIGNAVKPFYGRAAGNKLTALLKEHILGAVDVLKAAKAGDADAIAKAKAAWYVNGDEIADFLHQANPRQWKRGEMRAMMRHHLDHTLTEAVARLEGRFQDDVRAYDAIHRQILGMADMLSSGIVKQFPKRFR